MSSLEDKIKALLEQSNGAVSETELNEKFAKKDAADKDDQDDDQEDMEKDQDDDKSDDKDPDQDGDDDSDKDGDTDNDEGDPDDEEDKDDEDGDDGETMVSKQNKVKVAEGIDMKDHIEAILNGETLSEEFKSKVTNIFEAAVEDAAKSRLQEAQEAFDAKLVELDEQHEAQLVEAVSEVRSELEEQIDGFLNVVVEQWVEDNRVALERGIQIELTHSFIDGLKNLFKEHYVEVPESKVDVVEEQAQQIAELESTLEEAVTAVDQLAEEVVSLKKAAIVENASSTMTAVEKEKFVGLVESVDFVSEDDFTTKVKAIKENYFGKAAKPVTESKEEIKTEVKMMSEDTMSAYAAALTKNLKFS